MKQNQTGLDILLDQSFSKGTNVLHSFRLLQSTLKLIQQVEPNNWTTSEV